MFSYLKFQSLSILKKCDEYLQDVLGSATSLLSILQIRKDSIKLETLGTIKSPPFESIIYHVRVAATKVSAFIQALESIPTLEAMGEPPQPLYRMRLHLDVLHTDMPFLAAMFRLFISMAWGTARRVSYIELELVCDNVTAALDGCVDWAPDQWVVRSKRDLIKTTKDNVLPYILQQAGSDKTAPVNPYAKQSFINVYLKEDLEFKKERTSAHCQKHGTGFYRCSGVSGIRDSCNFNYYFQKNLFGGRWLNVFVLFFLCSAGWFSFAMQSAKRKGGGAIKSRARKLRRSKGWRRR